MKPKEKSKDGVKERPSVVVKIGGSVLESAEVLASLAKDVALVHRLGVDIVLVHGGGPAINEELKRRGITWTFFEGQRVTTSEMMNAIETVLREDVGARIEKAFHDAGVAVWRPNQQSHPIFDCVQADEHLGQVGKIVNVRKEFLDLAKDGGKRTIPVIPPLGHASGSEVFNINADWAASHMASSLGVKRLVFLTDQDGILRDEKVVSEVDVHGLGVLIKENVVSGGMLAKVRTILSALNNGVEYVHVMNAKRPQSLVEALFEKHDPRSMKGTLCTLKLMSEASVSGKDLARPHDDAAEV